MPGPAAVSGRRQPGRLRPRETLSRSGTSDRTAVADESVGLLLEVVAYESGRNQKAREVRDRAYTAGLWLGAVGRALRPRRRSDGRRHAAGGMGCRHTLL